jgi:hypothetical protein
MANRLQLKRGTGAPGSIFYEGEPIFDLGDKALYVGDTDAAGAGAGTSIASAETFLASLQILTRATTTSAGAINLYEDADNGTSKVQLIAPASLSGDVTLILPTADGNAGDTIVTDGSGNLSFVGVVTSFVFSGDTGEDVYQSQVGGLLFEGGEGIDTVVTDNKLTITAEVASATNAGIASYQSSQFYFENTYTVGVVTATTTDKGIASFNADDFDVATGEVTLEDTVLKTVTTDSGALTPSGHSLSILGGEGLDVTHAGTTITVAGEDASDTNKGIASFSSQYFTVSSGNVTIADSSVGVVTAIVGTANEVEVSRTDGTVTIGLPDNVTIGNDLTVNGNLRVVGTAVTFETEVIKVEDRLIELGLVAGATDANTSWDLGIAFNYGDGTAKKAGVFWLDNQFIGIASAISITNDEGTTDADPQVSITTFAPIAANALYIGGITAGDEVINSSKEAVNLIFDGGTYS